MKFEVVCTGSYREGLIVLVLDESILFAELLASGFRCLNIDEQRIRSLEAFVDDALEFVDLEQNMHVAA